MHDRLLVMLCTYNERENIGRLIPEIHQHAPDADVLIVDDNSPDGTGELAAAMSGEDTRIRVLHREKKAGLGAATLAGFRLAIEQGYDYLINMDADFSHPPSAIPALRAGMERADVCIGSRYIPGGGIRGWGWLRHFMSRGVNWYSRLLLGLRTRDNSGSFRCYRISKLAELDFDRVRSKGYAFQEEILYRCRRIDCRFEETPIIFEDRRHGSSKINAKEVVTALWGLFRLGLDNLFRVPVTNPQKAKASSTKPG
jgi:dolichol-phosphate mannosyltransferase